MESAKIIEEDVSGIKDDVVGTKYDMGGIKEDVSGVKEDVCGINDDVGGIKDDVGGIKEDVGGVKENVSGVKDDVGGTKDDVGGIKDDVGAIKEDVSGMKYDVKTLPEDVSGMKDIDEPKTRQEFIGDEIKEADNAVETEDEEKYKELKKLLKDDMIEFYNLRHSKVPLSPLLDENDTLVSSFYIRPEIDEHTSLSGVLNPKSKVNKEIYLTTGAGLGKTTFSKYLAIMWCKSNCSDESGDGTCFKKDDIDCMYRFEFVFLVLLQECDDFCSIDDLIFELIVSNLTHSKKFDKFFLREILRRETCLIILDGLDEWKHPDNPERPCYQTQIPIPHNDDCKTCTILTTSRSWKICLVNPWTWNELAEYVTFTQLGYESAVKITKKTLEILKSNPVEDTETKLLKFIEDIDDSDNVALTNVPLLLIYIVCLWYDGVEIGNSKCELYVNIVELLLSKTTAKHGELLSTSDPSSEILDCFKGHVLCTKYFSLLMALGELASYTLFNEQKENMLIFGRSVAETYLKDDEIKLSLLAGILIESTNKAVSKQISKVSFSHKTVQELFAAIFISSENDSQKTILEECKDIESILDMSNVCQFISGMNAERMCEISESIMSVINEDKKTREYRNGTGFVNIDMKGNPLYHVQSMLLSCLKEMPESEGDIKLCLQDWFIDGDSKHDFKYVSKLDKNNIKSLCIDRSVTSSEIVAMSSLTDLYYLQKLYFHLEYLQEAEINHLLSPGLQCLCLSSGKCTNNAGSLRERLVQIQNLQCLDISYFTFSHDIIEIFLNFISSTKTLREVTLSAIRCNEHQDTCKRMIVDLSNNSNLTKIDLMALPPLQLDITTPSLVDVKLSRIDIGQRSLLLSPEMSNIKQVELNVIEMSAECLTASVNAVEKLPQQVRVWMTWCEIKPKTKRESLRKYILTSERFDVTKDHYVIGYGWNFDFKTVQTSKLLE